MPKPNDKWTPSTAAAALLRCRLRDQAEPVDVLACLLKWTRNRSEFSDCADHTVIAGAIILEENTRLKTKLREKDKLLDDYARRLSHAEASLEMYGDCDK